MCSPPMTTCTCPWPRCCAKRARRRRRHHSFAKAARGGRDLGVAIAALRIGFGLSRRAAISDLTRGSGRDLARRISARGGSIALLTGALLIVAAPAKAADLTPALGPP